METVGIKREIDLKKTLQLCSMCGYRQ